MLRRKISLAYKLLVIISLSLGIYLNLINTTSISAMLSYYTMQSNIICLIYFIIFFIKEIQNIKYKTKRYYKIKGGIIICIAITACIYHIALAPGDFKMDSLMIAINNKLIANHLVHTVSPLLVIFDYIIFDKKGNFSWYYPFTWTVFPISYTIYVYSYSYLGGTFYSIGGSRKFAYFFLDYEKIGISAVIKWLIVILLFILGLSYILVAFDSKRKKNE